MVTCCHMILLVVYCFQVGVVRWHAVCVQNHITNTADTRSQLVALLDFSPFILLYYFGVGLLSRVSPVRLMMLLL